eukprot:7204950-Pyramimonas_sp.AAC.2
MTARLRDSVTVWLRDCATAFPTRGRRPSTAGAASCLRSLHSHSHRGCPTVRQGSPANTYIYIYINHTQGLLDAAPGIPSQYIHNSRVGLLAGALVYVCSDVPAVAADAAAQLEAAPPLRLRRFRGERPAEDVLPPPSEGSKSDPPLLRADAEGWLSGSPFGAGVVFTERDKALCGRSSTITDCRDVVEGFFGRRLRGSQSNVKV